MEILVEKIADSHYLTLPREVPGFTRAFGRRECLQLESACHLANRIGEMIILPACGKYVRLEISPERQEVTRTATRQSHRGPVTGTQQYRTQTQIAGYVRSRLHTTSSVDGWGMWFLEPISSLPKDVAEELGLVTNGQS